VVILTKHAKERPKPYALGTFPAGMTPFGVAFDGTHVWVTNRRNTVTQLDIRDGATYAVGNNPVVTIFDGNAVRVTNTGSHNVPRL
jgi:DNA-binding beta-propeller fold protein YncE